MNHAIIRGRWNDIHPEAEIGEGTDIWSWNYVGKAKIGERGHITNWVHIGDGVVIGDDCNFQPYVYIPGNAQIGNRVFFAGGAQLTDVRFIDINKTQFKEAPVVEDDVVFCNSVTVIGGITIGEGSVLGMAANAIKDIPPGEVWIGNPARYYCTRKEYNEKKRRYAVARGLP